MSKCNLPGPETTVHGMVRDTSTGLPIPNLQLEVVSLYNSTQKGNKDYTIVTTKADGSYYLKFTPEIKVTYLIYPIQENYTLFGTPHIILGQDNNINLNVYEMVNLNIHLTNNSTQNKNTFSLWVQSNNFFTGFGIYIPNSIKVDTLVKMSLPHLNTYTLQSEFSDYYSPTTAPITFKKVIFLGKADTTVNVVNP